MFSRVLLSLALVTSLVIAPTHHAQAEECAKDSCITVTTDDESDEIVVSFQRKGSTRSSTPRREEPKVSGSFSAISDRNRTWIPYHPDLYAAWREAARKAAATRARTRTLPRSSRPAEIVTTSLTDRVTQLIPFGSLHSQPAQAVIVGRPVHFWTPTPTSFDVTIRVAGIPVRLELTPSFEWGYGEGSPEVKRTTSLPGAPYPATINTFTYNDVGMKKVTLTTTWTGDFTVAGVRAPISGEIRQAQSKTLDVRPAPHHVLN